MLAATIVTPKVYTPTDEQRVIITSQQSALILGGPGRGKTATAIAAAADWLRRRPGESVLFTSFSNAAVQRVGEAAGLAIGPRDRRLQFRTFHGIAMEILRDFGRFAGLATPVRALDSTDARITAVERGWLDVSAEQRTEELVRLARTEGRVAFELMVPLAIGLLAASGTMRRAVSARYPFIVVDEFQDTRREQWELLKLIGVHSRVVALGDPDQMIYRLEHDAATRRVADFAEWKGIEPIRLTGKNFRCAVPVIPAFAEALLRGLRFDVPDRGVRVYTAHRKQLRAKLAEVWRFIRSKTGDRTSIGFIAPSAAIAHRIAGQLRNPGKTAKIPIRVHAHVAVDDSDLDAFRIAVCAAADWVRSKDRPAGDRLAAALASFWAHWSRRDVTDTKVNAIAKSLRPGGRSARPLRDFLSTAEVGEIHKFADDMLTAMQKETHLKVPAESLRLHGLPSFRQIAALQGSLFDEYRRTRAACGFAGDHHSRATTSVLTMHRSKGREFDYAVMIVDPRAHNGAATIDELRRLYYVAATRARKGLAVVYVPGEAGAVLAPVLGVPAGDLTKDHEDS